jgi:hypothetical protein
LSSLLRVLSPVLLVIILAVLAARRRLIRVFEERGADSPHDAIALPHKTLWQWWADRLTSAGVLMQTGDARFWLNRVEWRRYRYVRQRRVLIGVTALAAITAALVATGRWRPF